MIRRGYVRGKSEAFERFLARGRPAYVERERLSLHEALDVILANEGLPVIAHPGLLPFEDQELRGLLRRLTDSGVRGLEAYYPRHSTSRTELLLASAGDLDLMVTGGSDFHGFPEDSSPLSGAGDGFTVDSRNVARFLKACGVNDTLEPQP
jgi:predicted metal-dependent phosphoesterase TrpH